VNIVVVAAGAIVVIILALAIVAGVLMARRRSRRQVAEPDEPVAAPAEAAPMTGLEAALERATDRTGRPLRDRLDAETAHVDDLRVPDDTGPLLRRALDHVGQPGEATGEAPDPTPPGETDGTTEA
jgi:hypothetical protein